MCVRTRVQQKNSKCLGDTNGLSVVAGDEYTLTHNNRGRSHRAGLDDNECAVQAQS